MKPPKTEAIIAAMNTALAKKMSASEIAAYQQWLAKQEYA